MGWRREVEWRREVGRRWQRRAEARCPPWWVDRLTV
jgi:hypothetical protein